MTTISDSRGAKRGSSSGTNQDMKDLKGKIAVITGAGSGIGRALALALAEAGCSLAIGDVDARGLRETADLVGTTGAKASVHDLDVGKRDQVDQFAQKRPGRTRSPRHVD